VNVSTLGRGLDACPYLMLAVAACLTIPARAVGQEQVDPMASTVAEQLTGIAESFIALADAMPAEKYAFKPTNGEFKDVRTFAEQVKHVACNNFAMFNEIEKKEPPKGCGAGGPSPAKTKAELLAYLRDSFTYADRVLRTMTPANALEPAGGPYGGESTRLGLTTLAVWHASDHYGQLVMYVRMNGIVPPASQPAPVKPASALRQFGRSPLQHQLRRRLLQISPGARKAASAFSMVLAE
jgi:DinB family protein